MIFGANNAEKVEAMACRKGLNLAAEWFRVPIVLESDCIMVIRHLKESEDYEANMLLYHTRGCQSSKYTP